ncbi:MAG: hypothetical protein R2830_27355, partial [Saprospiraceae bacterium]
NFWGQVHINLEFEGLIPTAPGEAQFSQFRKNLMTFVAICKVNGIQPVLMTQFNRITVKEMNNNPVFDYFKRKLATGGLTVEQYCGWYERMNQITRDVAEEDGAILVDLDKAIPKTKENIYDLVHLTNQGSRLAAQVILEKLYPAVSQMAAHQ